MKASPKWARQERPPHRHVLRITIRDCAQVAPILVVAASSFFQLVATVCESLLQEPLVKKPGKALCVAASQGIAETRVGPFD
jgi:hypothetical protein